jgi:rhamnogalacturonyl hydrolase YesR
MSLITAQAEVAGMVHAGTPFDAIEDQISQMADLADDERSALWLYAWSRQRPAWQRSASTQILLWVANGRVADRRPTT